jgi:hypothetical protein
MTVLDRSRRVLADLLDVLDLAVDGVVAITAVAPRTSPRRLVASTPASPPHPRSPAALTPVHIAGPSTPAAASWPSATPTRSRWDRRKTQ